MHTIPFAGRGLARAAIRVLLGLLLFAPRKAGAQEDLSDLFDQEPFYEQAGVLRGKGDIPFFADVSFLRGSADSTQALLGIALSNSAFQFVKEGAGYRAEYEVDLRVKGVAGGFHNDWREMVHAASFDETLLNRETVVFQSAFGLLPGSYDLQLKVRDTQSGEESKLDSKLDVPRVAAPSSGYALSKPVLIRFYDTAATANDRQQVLYPSHYYETVPRDVSFFVEVYGAQAGGAEGLKLEASLVPDAGGPAVSTATLQVPALEEGATRVYGAVPGQGMQSGPYRLALALEDASGAKLAESSTEISVSAVTQWVRDHWKEAIELVAYEATKEERKALEDTPADRRLEAWNEFWRVRDPIPATPGNEAFENYFQRIAVANANFGTKLRSGWKSDRGRVYVAFGPPSDIIRRPIQSSSVPLEIWVYDNPGFEIVFEDRIGFGNYQIANPGTFANELAALQRRKERAIADRREAERQGKGGEPGSPAPATPAPAPTAPSTAPGDSGAG
jgi:GWxTD domain-containing protein